MSSRGDIVDLNTVEMLTLFVLLCAFPFLSHTVTYRLARILPTIDECYTVTYGIRLAFFLPGGSEVKRWSPDQTDSRTSMKLPKRYWITHLPFDRPPTC